MQFNIDVGESLFAIVDHSAIKCSRGHSLQTSTLYCRINARQLFCM